jgi:transposase
VGALLWIAEQLDVVGVINDAVGGSGGPKSVSLGEMVLAVALQRACVPGAKRHLASFLDGCLPRVSCLPNESFTGSAFHRLAKQVTDAQLEAMQLELAAAAVAKFKLATDVLAFDTTNFDTHIATTTKASLARRGHAKSKRADLRVVGLAVLVSETGHVPLLYRTYPGNSSDHVVLDDCLQGLAQLHNSLADTSGKPGAERTLVRDGGSFSEQLELDLDRAGYFTVVSLPLGNKAAETALAHAATRSAMKPLRGKLTDIRATRLTTAVGKLERTLVVVESPELLRGQKRGIAVALRKAKTELRKLEGRCEARRIKLHDLKRRVEKALSREHLSSFVEASIEGAEDAPQLTWWVDARKRHSLERDRLGKRVICTDRHNWSTERIVSAFRGQWNVEEVFRRAKKGGIVPWGPSHQWTNASLRLHTFATVLGLMLVSLAKQALGTTKSASGMMTELAEIEAILVRETGGMGRATTWPIAPSLTATQQRAVDAFELDRWLPILSTSQKSQTARPKRVAA